MILTSFTDMGRRGGTGPAGPHGARRQGKGPDRSAVHASLTLRAEAECVCFWNGYDLSLPYKFDIATFSAIENQNLIEHIDRVGVVLYQKAI